MDEPGLAGEADRRQQSGRLDDLRFGSAGAAQERAKASQPRSAEGQHRHRLVVGDRALALGEARDRRPGAGDAQRVKADVPAGDEPARQRVVAAEELIEGVVVLPGRDQPEPPREERQPLAGPLWGGDGRLGIEKAWNRLGKRLSSQRGGHAREAGVDDVHGDDHLAPSAARVNLVGTKKLSGTVLRGY